MNSNKYVRICILLALVSVLVMKMLYLEADAAGVFYQQGKELVICIDPGHGGSNLGAEYLQDGSIHYEKDMDLKIALYLKENLEKYKNVKVIITRTSDVDVSIADRAKFAEANGADYFISIHNNADANQVTDTHGCMVLMTVGGYQPAKTTVPSLEVSSYILSKAILKELTAMGIAISTDFDVDKTEGILRRPYSPLGLAKTTKYYPNGSVMDYYGVINNNVERGIPAIIIEHAYGNNLSDYRNYLSTDEQLKALADADCRGIVAALHLSL